MEDSVNGDNMAKPADTYASLRIATVLDAREYLDSKDRQAVLTYCAVHGAQTVRMLDAALTNLISNPDSAESCVVHMQDYVQARSVRNARKQVCIAEHFIRAVWEAGWYCKPYLTTNYKLSFEVIYPAPKLTWKEWFFGRKLQIPRARAAD